MGDGVAVALLLDTEGVSQGGGYLLRRAPENYPGKTYRRKATRLVLAHRLAWWEHYGVCPPEHVHVHHKDGDKTNNDINNLALITRADHARLHARKPGPTKHGTLSGYKNHKCRCDACRLYVNAYMATYKKARRQALRGRNIAANVPAFEAGKSGAAPDGSATLR